MLSFGLRELHGECPNRAQTAIHADGMRRGRPTAHLRPQNRKLLKWLDSWLATPDDRGEKRWNGFEDDLRNQRTTFRPAQTG